MFFDILFFVNKRKRGQVCFDPVFLSSTIKLFFY